MNEKLFIFIVTIVISVLVLNSKHKVYAATSTYYPDKYSSKYSSAYDSYGYKHVGYYYVYNQSGNTKEQYYNDVYMRD